MSTTKAPTDVITRIKAAKIHKLMKTLGEKGYEDEDRRYLRDINNYYSGAGYATLLSKINTIICGTDEAYEGMINDLYLYYM